MQTYVTSFALWRLGRTVLAAGFGCLTASLIRQVVPPGWRALRPGFGHWFAAVGSTAFSMLVAWVYLFVGSARHDAAFQMKVAFVLSIAFGLGAVYSAWRVRAIKRENIRWRGSRMVRNLEAGQTREKASGQAVLWRRTWSGLFALRFADGSTLYVDPFTRGSDEFMAQFGPSEDAEDIDGPPSSI